MLTFLSFITEIGDIKARNFHDELNGKGYTLTSGGGEHDRFINAHGQAVAVPRHRTISPGVRRQVEKAMAMHLHIQQHGMSK